MVLGIASASAPPAGRAFVAVAAAATMVMLAAGGALAQQPKPGAKPAQKPAAAPQASANQQQPQLIYSPWTKFCLKGQQAV